FLFCTSFRRGGLRLPLLVVGIVILVFVVYPSWQIETSAVKQRWVCLALVALAFVYLLLLQVLQPKTPTPPAPAREPAAPARNAVEASLARRAQAVPARAIPGVDKVAVLCLCVYFLWHARTAFLPPTFESDEIGYVLFMRDFRGLVAIA